MNVAKVIHEPIDKTVTNMIKTGTPLPFSLPLCFLHDTSSRFFTSLHPDIQVDSVPLWTFYDAGA